MSAKNKIRNLTSTITTAALSKVLMSTSETSAPIETPASSEIITSDISPSKTLPEVIENPAEISGDASIGSEDTSANSDIDTAEETTSDDNADESELTEDPAVIIEGTAEVIKTVIVDESTATSELAAAVVIAPIVDIGLMPIAPEAEVVVQIFESISTLPPYLARQRGYLTDYSLVMSRNNRPSSQEMGVQQRNLYQVLIMLFDLSGTEFITALDDLLQFINANRDYMFSDKYMFRAMDVIAVDQAGLGVFKQLMILLAKIADPADRALIRNHLDLNTAVRGVRNGERALALITEFLNI